MPRTRTLPDWEPCTDDSPFDSFAFSIEGHHEPSRALLLRLGRAVSYECGYGPTETAEFIATARLYQGYSGKHPTKYDLVACDADGIAEMDCDDEGNDIVVTDVTPTTWATMKCDPPRRGRRGGS